ncbi:hypothetical protein EP18_22705 [Lysinibacillus sphaericus]|nr:hypothetical protein EP18_22705 [Lysinibacillus sphaericus]
MFFTIFILLYPQPPKEECHFEGFFIKNLLDPFIQPIGITFFHLMIRIHTNLVKLHLKNLSYTIMKMKPS